LSKRSLFFGFFVVKKTSLKALQNPRKKFFLLDVVTRKYFYWWM